ncbi:hypothetical protein BO94DRAFT_461780, partial [Aspergillus sclerotioniger CBS 115572]
NLRNISFYFNLGDHIREVPDQRPEVKEDATQTANVFQWQATIQAELRSINDWVRKNRFYNIITEFKVPQDTI